MKDSNSRKLTNGDQLQDQTDSDRATPPESLPANPGSHPIVKADAQFQDDLRSAARYFEESLAKATRRAYANAWARFVKYCTSRNRQALPAESETIAGYLSSVAAEYADSTLRQHLAAIRHVHRRRFPKSVSPTKSALVENVLAGIVRSAGASDETADGGSSDASARSGSQNSPARVRRKADKAEPLRTRHLKQILQVLPGDGPAPPQTETKWYATWVRGLRDRALLLVGFAGALRRSEISGLRVRDLSFRNDGCLVHIAESKTDQAGIGEEIAVASGENAATCPVQALRRWFSAAAIDEGPVFRGVRRNGRLRSGPLTGRSISTIVKKAAEAAGIVPGRLPGTSKRRRFSGHSLRAGHITEANSRGAPDHLVMQQSRHTDRKTFDGYVRPEQLLSSSSSRHLGL